MNYEAVKDEIIKKGAMARVVRFTTTYAKDVRGRPIMGPEGTPRIEEMVELTHPGMLSRATIVKNIKELQPDPLSDPDNESAAITRALWEILEPQYRAWKMGQAIPENGTRLAAWPGLGADQAEVLRTFGVRTCEEFATATDSVLTRVPLPNIRTLQQDCRLFLEARSTNTVVASLEAKDVQIRTMEQQIADLRQIVLDMQESEKPKKRGRPPIDRDFIPDAVEEAAA